MEELLLNALETVHRDTSAILATSLAVGALSSFPFLLFGNVINQAYDFLVARASKNCCTRGQTGIRFLEINK